MKLIDADKMKEVFEISGFCGNCKRRGIFGCLEDIRVADVCSYIHEAPDVDAIPVEWIKKYEKTDDLAASIYRMLEAWGVDMSDDEEREAQYNDH